MSRILFILFFVSFMSSCNSTEDSQDNYEVIIPDMTDEQMVNTIQKQTFAYFIETADQKTGMYSDIYRINDYDENIPPEYYESNPDIKSVSSTGMSIIALIVGVQNGWISRDVAITQISNIISTLNSYKEKNQTSKLYGLFPTEINKADLSFVGNEIDVLASANLFQGLLMARKYFNNPKFHQENDLNNNITNLWENTNWAFFTNNENILYRYYNQGNFSGPIQGWNEGLIAYIIAASAKQNAISPDAYHQGWASGAKFINGKYWHGFQLPLGEDKGGPLYYNQYSFLGLNPNGLSDQYANYLTQNVNQTMINYNHCISNQVFYPWYSQKCWGVSNIKGGSVYYSPTNDVGIISPAALVGSLPYAKDEVLYAMRQMYYYNRDTWGIFGFGDSYFDDGEDADNVMIYYTMNEAIMVAMIENYKTSLCWNIFMSIPEIQKGLTDLGFNYPK